MCGLVAFVPKAMSGAMTSDMEMFTALLYMDALRGWDSTGVASFHTDGEMHILKESVEASDFIKTKEYKKLCTDFVRNGKAIIGHNRKATIGKIDDDTAHPFVIDDVDGKARFAFIHNGTLRNHEKLTEEKTDVDSEALGMVLTRALGDPQALEKELDNVQGAYACMWIDQETEKLYAVRNKERPLYLAKTVYGIIFSSEPGFVVAACSRANTKVDEIKLIDEHTLYSVDLTTANLTMTEDKLTVKKSVPLSYTTVVTKGGGANSTRKFQGEVSKNLFKKIRANYIGTTMGFWMDDYRAPASDSSCAINKPVDEWVIWGSDPDKIKFEHKCVGKISGMDESSLVWVCDSIPLYGKVEDVLYDQQTKSITFMLGECTMATPSQSSNHDVHKNWRH